MSAAKILAVDDEADFELLITSGFAARSATRNSSCALPITARRRRRSSPNPTIDLMLLDINVPVMDGLTLLARPREQRAELRTIIVSAYGDMQNLRTAMNRGAFDFVIKPVDLNDLEITVRKTIDDIARLGDIAARRGRTRAAIWPATSRPLSQRCWPTATSH
jgi:adenylate cyclase